MVRGRQLAWILTVDSGREQGFYVQDERFVIVIADLIMSNVASTAQILSCDTEMPAFKIS